MLSQSTNDRNRDVAFLRLRDRFDTWDAVRHAPVAEVEEAIRPGGISKVKSQRIHDILVAIEEANRADGLDLGWMREAPVAESRDFLCALPGVGRKTAACVLLFSYGLRDVPVDTHVSRVGMRLHLLRPGAPFEELHDEMLALDAAGRGAGVPRQLAAPRAAHVPRAATGVRGLRLEVFVSGTARVALATCAAFPDGDADDAGLPAAIDADVTFAVWDDPAVDWAVFDLVVVRSTWDYQERRDAFLAWAREIGDRLVNRPDVLAWNTDKRYLHELAAAGLPVVPTILVSPGAPFTAPAGEYVVKPTVSAGSRDTARFTDGEDERATALVAAIHASGRTAMVSPTSPRLTPAARPRCCSSTAPSRTRSTRGRCCARRRADLEVFAAETIEPRMPTDAELAVAGQIVDDAGPAAWPGPPLYARVDLVEDVGGAPLLLELELTEPSLFFAGDTARLARFAAAVQRRLASA